MADSRATQLFQQQSQLESDRSVLDSHYREIAERVLPRQDTFQRSNQVEGEKRTDKIFDSTAPLALDRAASAIDSLITPSTQTYHKLSPEDDRLEDDLEVKTYLDAVVRQLFRMRYRPIANFASQAHECYVSLMAFGTLGMFTDDLIGIGSRYKSIAMSELYIAENHAGVVDMVHRKFTLSARAAVMKWGDKVPEKIAKCAEREPFYKFDFLHCVKPNDNVQNGKRDYRGMAWSSYYASYEGQSIVDVGGYRTMPYAVSRHVTAPREVYGRSPAMLVLADIKMLNEMEKTTIRAAHKIVDPPLLLYGDGILSSFNARPNALNYGGVDEQGRQLVHPMKTGSNLPIVFEMTDQKRKMINDAFYVTLFQILVQNPQMTATEALIRAQEKGQLLAPTVGRQQSEFLGTVVERELDILAMSGALPPMPEKLRKVGGGVKVIYTSPLTRLRRAEDGVAIMRTLEFAERVAAAKQSTEVFDHFDTDTAIREVADIHGIPAKILRPADAVAAIRADRQRQQSEQQAMAGAEQLAKTAALGAKASSLMQPAPAAVQ